MSDENRSDDDSEVIENALKVGDNVFVRPESQYGRINMIEETSRGTLYHVYMHVSKTDVKKKRDRLTYAAEVPD